MGVTSRND